MGNGGWVYGRRDDILFFTLPTAVAFLLFGLLHYFDVLQSSSDFLIALVIVIGIDVAHVWSTLFRTYLDPGEWKHYKVHFLVTPLLLVLAFAYFHTLSGKVFWQILTYMAIFHFIRQQYGWYMISRMRAKEARTGFERTFDQVAIYTITGYPILWWHQNPLGFGWFSELNLFVEVQLAPSYAAVLDGLFWTVVGATVLKFGFDFYRGQLNVGKLNQWGCTFAVWCGGIMIIQQPLLVALTQDICHGLPYFKLTYRYSKSAKYMKPLFRLRAAPFIFFLPLFVLALLETGLWKALGSSSGETSPLLTAFGYGLLAMPAATHYVLDGFIWRSSSPRNANLAEMLGFTNASS